jgi:hypothetical protein
MTNTNNLKLIENKKPVEIVHELKNEYKIPSYEEFMKTYENDGNLNYDDLGHSDIGDNKGYGPTTYGYLNTVYFYRGRIIPNGNFCLVVECNN